ncbi:hypothetical protein H7X64_04845, partial [Armatimonadetes bacterium]|nr:hypothetical protein [bacterium]
MTYNTVLCSAGGIQVISIPLLGVGKPTLTVSMTISAPPPTNAIGEEVNIPLTITGLDKPQAISALLSFNGKNLSYRGTTSLSGAALD